MTPSFVFVDASTEIAAPRERVFAHWTDPAARERYEVPPGSGMRYLNFATKQDEVEEIEITHDGALVGRLMQRMVILEPPELIVSQITGVFGGVNTMALQVTTQFIETDNGTFIRGSGQVVDRTGREVKAEHEAGWAQMFETFRADFFEHGPKE